MSDSVIQAEETITPVTQDNSKYAPKGIPLETLIDLKINKKLDNVQIAKITNLTRETVSRRLNDVGISSVGHLKTNRADLLACVQGRIINSITEQDIKKASLLQKTTAISQLFDKERLERGQSTENVSFQGMIKKETEIDNKINDLLNKVNKRLEVKKVNTND